MPTAPSVPGPPPDARGRYEKKVKDYNFGSLIRTDARQEYSETNTIFVTRIQVRAPPLLTAFTG